MVVGDRALADNLQADLGPRAMYAANIFDAVGMISSLPVHEHVNVIALPSPLLPDDPIRVSGALRQIDPGVQRLVIVDPEDLRNPAPALTSAGFDAVLTVALDDPRLTRLLRRIADGEDTVELGHGPGDIESRPGREKASPPRPEPASEGQAAEPGSEEEQLGDVDLVAAVQEGLEQTLVVALQLIRQETGWKDATFEPGAPDGAGARVEVTSPSGRCFGALCSTAGADELTRWAHWLGMWLELAAEYARLQSVAYIDALTGAYNRRFFDEQLPTMLDDARRNRRVVTLMLFDVDDLKKFNDRYGHDAGDMVLRETVRLMRSVIRQGDYVCRLGGDEFCVIFADPEGPRRAGSSPPESIEIIAKRFQSQISQVKFPKLGPEAPGRLSVSAGLATFPWDGTTAEELVRYADHLAIESKRRGKNALTIGSSSGHEDRKRPEA